MDSGLQPIAQTFENAITCNGEERILILNEINLKGNQLTTVGIEALSGVIESSSSELRSLDLSDNNIDIRTKLDAIRWERFLHAFSQCSALRRLDLSNNNLGTKGFEILSKVYAREVQSNKLSVDISTEYVGLRSIPYLILSETALNNTAALYLSYVIQNHRLVSELLAHVPSAKPGTQTHQQAEYDEIAGCYGIIWKPNSQLEELGKRVLDTAESLRMKDMERNMIADEDSLGESIIEMSLEEHTPSTTRVRRDSATSTGSPSLKPVNLPSANIDRIRSRLQLEELKNGINQNDLWSTAMKMLRLTRTLFYVPKRPKPALSPSKSGGKGKIILQLQSLNEISHPKRVSFSPKPTSSPRKDESPKPSSPSTPEKQLYQLMSNQLNFSTKLSKKTIEMLGRAYRSDLPQGLPEHVLVKIILEAAEVGNVLDQTQQNKVIKWGSSKEALVEEYHVRGKPQTAQIWKALSGMGCLSYFSVDDDESVL
jgi:hypothetical protein